MKYVIVVFSVAFFAIFSACKSNKTKEIGEAGAADTAKYYSIKNFIESEIKLLDSMPYYMYQITTHDSGLKDSVGLSKQTFDSIAQQFANKDIISKHLQNQYKEQLFKDLSTNSVTINYTALDKDLPVQSIDVLTNVETGKVKRIFIRTNANTSDSTVSENYSWKAGKSFLITKTVLKPNATKYTTVQFVNWNDVTP
jgi:hypothetical protein